MEIVAKLKPNRSDSDRLLDLSNIEAEQALLGIIMVDNKIYEEVAEFLRAEHFFEPVHQDLYQDIGNILSKGLNASIISLKNKYDRDSRLENLGGGEYLHNLAAKGTTLENTKNVARVIYEYALKRNLVAISREMMEDIYSSEVYSGPEEYIEATEQKLFNLATVGDHHKSFIHVSGTAANVLEAIDRARKNPGNVSGVSTGFHDLNEILGGFQKSDLVIMAGRPGMGKTAFALNLALNAAEYFHRIAQSGGESKSVGFFSLEMSKEQLVQRLLASKAKVSSDKLTKGSLSQNDLKNLKRSVEQITELPIFLDDTPALSIAAIRTRARRLVRKHNLGILFIDYLQLIRGTTKTENRVLEITEISQTLKAIAKEFNIPVISLSQLSRASEQRTDKRPMLSDLRDSGSIEQDADIVIFLYRDSYYNSIRGNNNEATSNTENSGGMNQNDIEIILAKHRNGPVGKVALHFDPQYSRFTNKASNNYNSFTEE